MKSTLAVATVIFIIAARVTAKYPRTGKATPMICRVASLACLIAMFLVEE